MWVPSRGDGVAYRLAVVLPSDSTFYRLRLGASSTRRNVQDPLPQPEARRRGTSWKTAGRAYRPPATAPRDAARGRAHHAGRPRRASRPRPDDCHPRVRGVLRLVRGTLRGLFVRLPTSTGHHAITSTLGPHPTPTPTASTPGKRPSTAVGAWCVRVGTPSVVHRLPRPHNRGVVPTRRETRDTHCRDRRCRSDDR